MKTVSPVGDRVFVKVMEAKEATKGGILLPTASQKKPAQGEVVNAGGAKGVKVMNATHATAFSSSNSKPNHE